MVFAFPLLFYDLTIREIGDRSKGRPRSALAVGTVANHRQGRLTLYTQTKLATKACCFTFHVSGPPLSLIEQIVIPDF